MVSFLQGIPLARLHLRPTSHADLGVPHAVVAPMAANKTRSQLDSTVKNHACSRSLVTTNPSSSGSPQRADRRLAPSKEDRWSRGSAHSARAASRPASRQVLLPDTRPRHGRRRESASPQCAAWREHPVVAGVRRWPRNAADSPDAGESSTAWRPAPPPRFDAPFAAGTPALGLRPLAVPTDPPTQIRGESRVYGSRHPEGGRSTPSELSIVPSWARNYLIHSRKYGRPA